MHGRNLGHGFPRSQAVAQAAACPCVRGSASPKFPHLRTIVRKFLFSGLTAELACAQLSAMGEQKDSSADQIAAARASRVLGELGDRIADLRDRKGWRQVTLARRAGLRPERLSRIVRRIEIPRADEFVRIASVFGVSLDELAYGPEGLPKGGLSRLAAELESLASPEVIAGLAALLQLLALGIKSLSKTSVPASSPRRP